MFSGRWDDGLERDAEGRIFIDQSIDIFLPLVNYLRQLDYATRLPNRGQRSLPQIDKCNEPAWYRMLDYYDMTLGVYPIGVYKIGPGYSDNFTKKIVIGHPDYEIDSKELATFCLLPREEDYVHQRYLKSFEVFLGVHSSVQIGWLDWSKRGRFGTQKDKRDRSGVGYDPHTIALDIGRKCIAANLDKSYTHQSGASLETTENPIQNCSINIGSAIRCVNRGTAWCVDAKYIRGSDEKTANAVEIFAGRMSAPVPCLTVRGNVRIAAIEF